jgi:NAD(P)-dependent dehydrogenase (short-subunit alcohol dehydrogenase family)
MRLKEKVVIVTGAGRGIGREICLRVADEGAQICACDRDRKCLEELAGEMRAENREPVLLETDIGREDQVEAMFKETLRTLGKVDILVNNVGVLGPVSPIQKIAGEEWKAVVQTNLNGTYYCIKHALDIMIPNRSGNIINIGSVAAVINPPNRSVYSATKSAIVSLTRTVAAEVGQYNIRCNCISPGLVEGERLIGYLTKMAKESGKSFEELRQGWLNQIPLRRFISGSDIARAVIFFASDESAAVTGQHLCVSGGQEIV